MRKLRISITLKLLIAITTLFVTQSLALAQTKTFEWEIPTCYYQGVYDSTKVTEAQLRDTYLLCFSEPRSYYLQTESLAWEPEEIDKLNLNSLEAEYTTKLKRLQNLNLIKSPFWEELRKNKIGILTEQYELKKITIEGYKNPISLKKYSRAGSCFKYIDAIIAGGDKLLNLWQQLADSICKENLNPSKCYEERFLKKINTPEKFEYAKVEVMLFGWYNCAVRYSDYPGQGIMTEEDENFNKLFISVTRGCDQ